MLRFYLEKLESLKYEDVIRDKRLYHRYYKRLWRFIASLEKKGLVEISKKGGFLWIKPTPKVVDWISLTKQNKNHAETHVSEKNKVSNKHKHPLRFVASGILMSKKMLEVKDWRELYDLLEEYEVDVGNRVIVLGKRVESDEDERSRLEFMFLHYKHRFLRSELKRKLKEYDVMFENASRRYDVGVFLTLTMDPETYPNLYQASKRIYDAMNRFRSFLRKRLGRSFDYIAVLEPSDRGVPHLHVVVFGVGRIEDHFKLTEILARHGFGFVHWEYKIRKVRGMWVWSNPKHKPERAKTGDVRSYLKKYLVKTFRRSDGWRQGLSVSDFKLGFYFATNKRFFTSSRSLMVKRGVRVSSGWFFVGSWHWRDVPDWVCDIAGVVFVPDGRFVWRADAFYVPPPLFSP